MTAGADSPNQPSPIAPQDWARITAIPEVREAWGWNPEQGFEDVIPTLYGARFDFVSGGPGYVGPLYMIQGDSIDGSPLVIIQDGSRLRVA